MECLYTEKAWSSVLKEQEEKIAYTSFPREKALELGLLIEKITREIYHGSVAIKIIEEESVIFSYRMEGSVRDADWWMHNKFIAARFVRMSSLRALVSAKYGEFEPMWNAWDSYVCGGCVPVLNKKGGRPFAYVVISGMKHYEDHQIIVDAMAEQLGVEVPRIYRGMEL